VNPPAARATCEAGQKPTGIDFPLQRFVFDLGGGRLRGALSALNFVLSSNEVKLNMIHKPNHNNNNNINDNNKKSSSEKDHNNGE
jgi:hypothetical protein